MISKILLFCTIVFIGPKVLASETWWKASDVRENCQKSTSLSRTDFIRKLEAIGKPYVATKGVEKYGYFQYVESNGIVSIWSVSREGCERGLRFGRISYAMALSNEENGGDKWMKSEDMSEKWRLKYNEALGTKLSQKQFSDLVRKILAEKRRFE